ncbi:disulfide isomerase 1-4 [Spatholobus suberectus]|nr:disulfide isomerase 1-4 [Spatholobus suberectus]
MEPVVDDKDVVVLKERNFTIVIENNRFVIVEFYATWCDHCQALALEYAATELKLDNVVLAKVDTTMENKLTHEYDIQGFPIVFFFVNGIHKPRRRERRQPFSPTPSPLQLRMSFSFLYLSQIVVGNPNEFLVL